MSYSLLAKKLMLEKERYIDSNKIKGYCRILNITYYSAIGYLLSENYLNRILRGVFYINTAEERKLGAVSANYMYAIKKAFEIKGIKNWYFGLDSALKMNNLTHETFLVDSVITDRFRNHKPILIFGNKVSFIALNIKDFKFGIINKEIPYSDGERTVLDMVYLLKYRGAAKERIGEMMGDYIEKSSRKKIGEYLAHYPKTIAHFIDWYYTK